MQAKYDSLIQNGTWKLALVPENGQVFTDRCFFQLKKDCNGHVLKSKARSVAHGFRENKSIDLVDTFATVVKFMSYKYLFGVTLKCGYKIWQMDIVTTFLYRFLDEIIHVERFYLFNFIFELVCHLCKTFSRLKLAPQIKYQTLPDLYKKLGLERLELDHGDFVSQDQHIHLAVYVDDLLSFSLDDSHVTDIQNQFNVRFEITNLGEISHYLGIEIDVEIGKKISLC